MSEVKTGQIRSGSADGSQSTSGLKGQLGTLDIALTTLAYAGPLAGTAGYITFVVGFGNGLGAPSAFLVVMAAFLLFAVGYSALSRFVPNPGAFYAYITSGLGRAAGLGAAFMVLASYFCIGVGFYGFAGLAFQDLVVGWGGPKIEWYFYSLIFWAVVGTLAYFHIAVSAKVLGVVLIVEVLLALMFDAAVMVQGGAEGISLAPFTWEAFSSGNVGLALIFGGALFCGFEATAIYREETKNPDKTIPRATYLVVLFIGCFYALTSWALITGLGNSQAVALSTANTATAFFDVSKVFVGDFFYKIVTLLLITSIFASHLSIQNATTRYVFSLAIDGVFPKALGVAHSKHSSPARASLTCSLIYLLLTASMIFAGLSATKIYAWFCGLASFSILIAMAITSLSAIVYFRRNKHHPVNAWQSLIAPGLSLLTLGAMILLAAENFATLIDDSQALADVMMYGVVLTFVFGFIYALWLKKSKPHIYQRIGRQMRDDIVKDQTDFNSLKPLNLR
ncbi:APC family permease [Pseudomonas sp. TH10]|uniref:APC family permease n=1 Tax=Pseudomonas sp. TH10 TaxID=2796376 RepID=UPI0019125E51|nr:APC family permease [Pseudomonas sp. TH10]MBK5516733.1 APC family permease [Pseudomonas sp. TH10]